MFRCEMCGAVFDRSLVLNHLDPRPDCFMERIREVQCPYCNGPYFNEFEEDKQMIVNVKYRDSLTGVLTLLKTITRRKEDTYDGE